MLRGFDETPNSGSDIVGEEEPSSLDSLLKKHTIHLGAQLPASGVRGESRSWTDLL